mmetsp:Transcript_20307/g.45161  ORF Transcript_20307/g.45161 Transcript_20307/m.45161 type:complete len:407 (-) Transcript_20307:119-1339(-)
MVMCTLHGDMRVGEKLMNLFLARLRLREDLDTATKKRRWKALEGVINAVIQIDTIGPLAAPPSAPLAPPEAAAVPAAIAPLGPAVAPVDTGGRPVLAADTVAGGLQSQESLEDFVRRTCTTQDDPQPLGLDEVHVQNVFRLVPYASKDLDFKMDCCIQHKMWAGIKEILDCVYTIEECSIDDELWGEKMEWQALFSSHVEIWARLRVPGVMSAARIDKLQLRMDAFCRLFVERFGWNNLTNYLHNMMGGHFRYFLRKFGNLFEQSNIGLEANVKVLRTFVQRGTQHDGHCGNSNRKAKKARITRDVALAANAAVEEEEAHGGTASKDALQFAAWAQAEATAALAILATIPLNTRRKMNLSRAIAGYCSNHIAAQLGCLTEDSNEYMHQMCAEGKVLAKLPPQEEEE